VQFLDVYEAMSIPTDKLPRKRPVVSHILSLSIAVVLAILVSACGVPSSGGPQTIAPSGVPFGLLSNKKEPVQERVSPAHPTAPVSIYLLDQGHLAPVAREVHFPAPLPTLATEALDALLAGPTLAEAENGYQTAISTGTRLLSVSVTAGVATVNFSSAFGMIVGADQIPAVAQVVYTITGIPGISSVAFQISGQPIAVPVPGTAGAQVNGPVSRAQFPAQAI
jgi:spore germination protein GerM